MAECMKKKVEHDKKEPHKGDEKPLSDEELSAIMDERVRKELKNFLKNPPPPISKEDEDGARRRNEDGWL